MTYKPSELRRIAAGLCVRCGVTREKGRMAVCAACSAGMVKRDLKQIAAGLCKQCGRKRKNYASLCDPCGKRATKNRPTTRAGRKRR